MCDFEEYLKDNKYNNFYLVRKYVYSFILENCLFFRLGNVYKKYLSMMFC